MSKYLTGKVDRVSMTRSEHLLLYPSLIIMSKSDVYQSLTSWLPPVLSLQWALKPLTNARAASYGDSALILASAIGVSS